MAVTTSGGHIIVRKGGVKQFGTDTPFLNLFPDKQVVVTVPVTFPDFPKDWIYGFSRETISVPEGFDFVDYAVGYAIVLSKIMPQEWNASQVIGSIPAGCNYIDVRAFLTWTKFPSATAGSPVASPLNRSGSQVHLQGGSGVLEIGNGFRRSIHIGLSGTNIVLTKYQSSRSIQPVTYSAWGLPTQVGWSYLTSPYGTVQNKIGQMTTGGKPGSAWVPPYRSGPNDPGVNLGPDDHSSNWSIQFIITPGRYNAGV